jgi:Uma2 family endonuclease
MVCMTVEYLPPELEDVPGLKELPAGPLTIDDLERIWERVPDSGYRFELDDGVLVVYGAPSLYHQLAQGELNRLLGNARTPEFRVVPTPGVVITPTQFRIPDLTVLRADRITPGMRHYPHPPELAVEIASPSTSRYDQTRKKQVYAEFGIPDYWIVTPDPDKPDITAYQLTGTHYERVAYASGEEVFTASRPFRVSFTPAELIATGLG